MDNIITLIIMFSFGVALRKTNKVKDGDNKIINTLLINVFLPAMILFYMHSVKVNQELIISSMMPWTLTIIGIMFFGLIGKQTGMSRETIGCLILTASAGNTAFLGLPMVQALVGDRTLPLAISIDQLGSTPCILTLGVFLANSYSSSSKFNLIATLKKIISFPPFIATLIAIALNGMSYNPHITTILQKLSGCVAPLALLSIGMQLHFGEIREHIKPLIVGLSYRIIFAPLAVFLVLCLFHHALDENSKTILIDSMMGTQITALVLAQEYNLNGKLATLMMCISVPLSLMASILLCYFI